MKGIVCERPDLLRSIDLPEQVPEAGEALVSIKRIGICGTDLHAFKGNQPFFVYPRILGHELSGVVEQLGAGVDGVAVGDQVSVIPYLHCGSCVACRLGKTNCCVSLRVLGVHEDGGMRERFVVPATHLIRTDGLSLDESALLEPLAIGAHAVRRGALAPGETSLVIGAGPIGLGVMAFAKRAGARVIAMDVNEERLAFCRAWAKADGTVNALDQPERRLAELTGGDMPTTVFDATGNAGSMTKAFGLAAHGGKLVYVGLVKADITFHDPEFHKRELTLLGSRNATRDDFGQVLAAVRQGDIASLGYITHQAPFDELIGEFPGWMNPANKVIKAMAVL